MACDWHQSSEARVERRQLRTRRSHTSSKWLWITKVKVCMYVPSWRTCLRWLEDLFQGQAAGPKRGRSQGHTINSCMVSTRKETRCKAHVLTPRKMDTRNGETRRWLSGNPEQAARPYAPAGRMAQEANAQSNIWDMLTWAGCQGR